MISKLYWTGWCEASWNGVGVIQAVNPLGPVQYGCALMLPVFSLIHCRSCNCLDNFIMCEGAAELSVGLAHLSLLTHVNLSCEALLRCQRLFLA